MTQSAPPRFPPLLMLLTGMLTIQGGAAIAKGLFPAVGAMGTAGLRVVLAAALLTLLFRPPFHRIVPAHWRLIVPYGLALGLMNLSFYASLERLPLGVAVTIEFTGPLALSLYLSRRPADFLWVLLAAAGIALMAPRGELQGLDPVGMGFALLAGFFWALYILAGSRVSRELSGTISVTAGMWVAAAVTVPFAVLGAGASLLAPNILLAGLGVALLSSAVPYTLEMQAMKFIPPKVFGVLSSLEPALAAIAGLLLLGEQLSPVQWTALVLVMLASVGMTLTNQERGEPQESANTLRWKRRRRWRQSLREQLDARHHKGDPPTDPEG
ncbi:EamA family transporter [Deinococcus radiophilus]|uniref:EamA family transporter n=2 Tax=Deinococcus radiophilus TaxID=32062 RepID=A0A431VZH8_9DEIO|nr:EamA family transporter [Deinococcus radiophilus]RTR28614.1 EamA family transporter [Deinococcus radiophilus]UFA51036.1 EamA family transporter [Deinococcus radiophilus]